MNTSNSIHIRVGRNTLAFAAAEGGSEGKVVYEPYVVKSSMSLSANLREAFRSSPLLGRNFSKAIVAVDTNPLLVPAREFREEEAETLYRHTYPAGDGANTLEASIVRHNVLTNLNAAVVYEVNRDVHTVLQDHFSELQFFHLMQPVWGDLHGRNFGNLHAKLYAYMHGKRAEVFCFDKNRFRFYNAFDTAGSSDTMYFLLAVWQQLALDSEADELHLVFDTVQTPIAEDADDREKLLDTLRKYVRKVVVLDADEAFQGAHFTRIKNFPFDLMAALKCEK